MTEFPLARRSQHLLGSVIDSSTGLLARQSHDVVRFAMGAPEEDLLPVADLDVAFAKAAHGRYDYGERKSSNCLTPWELPPRITGLW